MSLRFCFGPSGSGKSHRIYEEIMQRAAEEPGRNFLIIVPDQFTMQTQKDLVMRSDRDGILNIDVLSFGRLSHRILSGLYQGSFYHHRGDTGCTAQIPVQIKDLKGQCSGV